MEQPPPYEANNADKGFTNPVYSITQGYDPSNYSSNPGYPTTPSYPTTPGYPTSPDYTTTPGYPTTHGYTATPGHTTTPGYTATPDQNFTPMYIPSPGYTSNPGYTSSPGYTTTSGYTSSPGYTSAPGSTGQPKPADTVEELSGFGEAAVRRGFIRKVYSILSCQLLITGGVIAIFLFVSQVKEYVQANMWVYWSSFGITLACIFAMACFQDVRRTSPGNFICLGIFTICESLMLGTISTYYEADEVLLAVGITVAVTFGLTVFSFQTKIDFTRCGGVLFAALLVLFIAGICLSFTSFGLTNIIYASCGALLFSFYIIYDTQMMMGGKHKYSVSPEEYIFAALNLYLDIINLFLFILRIVGSSRK